MASLIKNQILKHLSKFAKNLSHDQIHLSTLKGEGELTNLELNDQVLTELLELPSWLRLSSATCNRVTVRIQWTKLKSVPIYLFLDEVRVEVETCEDLRPTSSAQSKTASALSGGSHYGFSDKVVDGISLSVNSVLLTLRSHAFVASIQLSRIVVESKSPVWQKADLRMTRLKDTEKGELLIFKELSWQTVRIEAKSTKNEDLTPLRLITNQARCRITIKKRLSDCSVLGCRLVLILDDLLWVLTDDQLKAALHFGDSLSGLLKRATEETQKTKGARKLESLSVHNTQSKDSASKKKAAAGNDAAKVFARYDVIETSYHLYSDRIDLHLCDDPGGMGRSCHPKLSEGGAFQVSLSQLQVDFYPYHLASGDRSAWIRYQESIHAAWLENSLTAFQSHLLDALLTAARNLHTPLARSHVQQGQVAANNVTKNSTPVDNNSAQIKSVLMNQFGKLMTTNLVVRLNNFTMWKVSTSKAKSTPKEFLSGDRRRYSLPEDMNVMHFEYTQFYYPGDTDFPLPPPKLFAYFNPIQLSLDPLTVLWLNAFALNLQRSVKILSVEQAEPPYLDVKLEAIMFRLLFDASDEEKQVAKNRRQTERPASLHFQASRIVAANYRSLETGTKADLAKCLNSFQDSELFFGTDFPNESSDIPVVCDKMVLHATGGDDLRPNVELQLPSLSHQDWWPVMKKDLLWTEAKDIWFVNIDPFWADFHGVSAVDNRAVPFLDAFPLTLWLFKDDSEIPKVPQNAKMHLLVQVSSLVSLQLNHFQFLFLMRMLETISEITTFLTQDVSHILGEEDESSIALGLVAPQIDVSLLMPLAGSSPVKENPVSSPNLATFIPVPVQTKPAPVTIENQRPTLCSIGDPLSESAISAPASPSKMMSAVTLHSAESVPEIRNHLGTPGTSRLPAPSPKPMMTPPTIQLPASIPSSEGSTARRGKTYKPVLASSLSNMMAQLDSFRPSPSSSSVALTDEDTLSVMSDDSDNSESYVVVNQGDAPNGRDALDSTLFAINSSSRASPVEIAVEVTEETSPCESFKSEMDMTSSASAALGSRSDVNCLQIKDGSISVVTFHIGRIELAQQSIGRHSCIKLQAASLSGEECPQITWEEFQAKFANRSKGWSESTLQPPSTWCFRMRFSTSAPDYSEMLRHATLDATSMSLKEKISRATEAYIDLKAKNLPLQFYTSTLNGLADLFEDEIIPTAIPMKVELENLALHLLEDRPPPNSTSPGSLPVDVAIPSLTILRDKSGLFSIQPSGYSNSANGFTSSVYPSFPEVSRPRSSTHQKPHLDLVRCGINSSTSIEAELQQRASLLAVDNAGLRNQLENANAELNNLRSRIQELDMTRSKLVKVQQQALALDKENATLKKTLKYLQEELVKTGKRTLNQN